MIGRAAPCLVHGCTIRNNSSGSIYVRILYEPITTHDGNVHERRVEFQLGKRSETKVDEEEFNMGSYQVRETIRTVEVTRANGQVDELHAPFDNVNGIELDWLFVIEERTIKSGRFG
ncbi:unnamed protein product [Adineta ricciae]|uniref:Uncharacterized protein n=1 Tax=Adineta ricciae TaxID=249248 RepID=A0A814HBC1_ADIRI|nr:unnamed protein product [Adineta ricciae]CAF1543815.1 unnamed protein product [Adineta ricciae]